MQLEAGAEEFVSRVSPTVTAYQVSFQAFGLELASSLTPFSRANVVLVVEVMILTERKATAEACVSRAGDVADSAAAVHGAIGVEVCVR